jgi:hypothetical protein
MGVGQKIGAMVIGYCVLGGLLALTQLGLSKLFEPPCHGIPLHTLWADFRARDMLDVHDALEARHTGKHDEPFIAYVFRLVRGLARWLPDLYQHVITGDMTVQNYLLGGFACYTGFPLPSGFSAESPQESGNTPDEPAIITHDVWTEEKGVRKPQ